MDHNHMTKALWQIIRPLPVIVLDRNRIVSTTVAASIKEWSSKKSSWQWRHSHQPSLWLWWLRPWSFSGSTLEKEPHSGDNVVWFETVGCGGGLRRRRCAVLGGLRLKLVIVPFWSLAFVTVTFTNDWENLPSFLLKGDFNGFFLKKRWSGEGILTSYKWYMVEGLRSVIKLTEESVVKTCATFLLWPVSVVVTYPNTLGFAESRTTQHTVLISWDVTNS